MISEKYLAPHIMSTEQALEQGGLRDICALPGTENPAGGLTRVRCDMAVLLRKSESERSNPVSWKE